MHVTRETRVHMLQAIWESRQSADCLRQSGNPRLPRQSGDISKLPRQSGNVISTELPRQAGNVISKLPKQSGGHGVMSRLPRLPGDIISKLPRQSGKDILRLTWQFEDEIPRNLEKFDNPRLPRRFGDNILRLPRQAGDDISRLPMQFGDGIQNCLGNLEIFADYLGNMQIA